MFLEWTFQIEFFANCHLAEFGKWLFFIYNQYKWQKLVPRFNQNSKCQHPNSCFPCILFWSICNLWPKRHQLVNTNLTVLPNIEFTKDLNACRAYFPLRQIEVFRNLFVLFWLGFSHYWTLNNVNVLITIEVFVNNTNLTKIKLPPVGLELTTLTTKSEVVHKTKFILKISYSTHDCLAQLDQHQTCKPVMVSVVSSSPTGGNFIFLKTPQC